MMAWQAWLERLAAVDWQHPEDWSATLRLGIPGLLGLLLSTMGWLLLEMTLFERLHQQRLQQARLIADCEQQAGLAAGYRDLERLQGLLQQPSRQLQDWLPEQMAEQDSLQWLTALALASGVSLEQLGVQERSREGHLEWLAVAIDLQGPFVALDGFLHALWSAPRLLGLRTLQIQAMDGDDRHLSAVLMFYAWNTQESVP